VIASTAQHQTNIDLDRRINEEAGSRIDLRRSRDEQIAALTLRLAVLETQLRYFADRMPPSTIGIRK
jgi:hypothetical protein